MIWIDSNEAALNKGIVNTLSSKTLVKVAPLPGADYLILARKNYLVQRKTINDLLGSLADKRLWHELMLMKEVQKTKGYEPRLLIEGSWYVLKFRGWNPKSLMMQLDSVLDDYDVKIMYSPHVGYTVSWLIAKSCDVPETEPPKEFPLRGWKPKGMSLNDRILFTLEGVVGHMTAKSILRKFRTLENVAKATMEQLMEVEGVGEKRAKLVYDVFHTEWQEVEDAQSPT